MLRLLKNERDKAQPDLEASMTREIAMLREAMETAHISLESGEGDVVKIGALICRLSDSIGRGLLVQQRLSSTNDDIARIRAELDHVMRVIEPLM